MCRLVVPLLVLLCVCCTGYGKTSISSDFGESSEAAKKKLELENAKLQLEIEKMKRESTHLYLYATSVGLVTAIAFPLAGALWALYNAKRERRRVAPAEFGGAYASAIHAMSWYTWKKVNGSSDPIKDIDQFDSDMHAVFPSLSGALLKAPSYDETFSAFLMPFYNKVVDKDSAIAKENIKLLGKSSGPPNFAQLHKDVTDMWKEISPKMFKLSP